MPDTMIVNRLSRLLGERRMSVAELQRLTGLSYVTLYNLYSNKSTRLDIETLNKICGALGVTTSDILEYQPDTATPAQDLTRLGPRSGLNQPEAD